MYRPLLPLLALVLVSTGCRDARQVVSLTPEMEPIVDGTNGFAVDMYQVARTQEGNLFFSPFSIASALSMLEVGAEGETQVQVDAALGLVDEAAWHENMGALFQDLGGDHGRGYTLHVANAVWGQEGVSFLEPALATLEESYGAPLQEADFIGDATRAADAINTWVDDQTAGRIPDLFEGGDLDANTRLVLVNAIYFLAEWAAGFDEEDTSEDTFTLASGEEVEVPMMRQSDGEFGYADVDGVQILEMPYEDEEISMVLLLPPEGTDLSVLEDALTVPQLEAWISALDTTEPFVMMPTWEQSCELALADQLQALGITDAFSDALGDFSGFAEEGSDWYVAASRHKAWVRVDEQGTEAAAATGFGVSTKGDDGGGVEFQADRPFLYLIRDMLTGTVLFLGRMEDPR